MKTKISRNFLAICTFLAALPALSQPVMVFERTSIPAVNEIYKDSTLTDFIAKLQYAIYKRDKSYLISVVDTNVTNTVGGEDGIEAFQIIWEMDGADSQVWFYLSKLISMGGKYTNQRGDGKEIESVVFPSFYGEKIDDRLDIFSVMVTTGDHINIREKPLTSSKILGQLNYDIVTVDFVQSYPPFKGSHLGQRTYYGEKEWYYVTSLDKKTAGYVYWDYLWSPVGYRMYLNKVKGEWKITCLKSGK